MPTTETWVELQDLIDSIDASDADMSQPEPDYDKLFEELDFDDAKPGDVEWGQSRTRV